MRFSADAELSSWGASFDARRISPGRGQGGFGFVEVLVAILLTATVISAIASGMLALMRSSQRAEDRQHLQLAVANFTESIKSIDYLNCGRIENGDGVVTPGEYDYNSYPNHLDADSLAIESISIEGIRYWKRGSVVGPSDAAKFVPFAQSSCAATPATDAGAQEFTVSARYRGLTLNASVVKRRT